MVVRPPRLHRGACDGGTPCPLPKLYGVVLRGGEKDISFPECTSLICYSARQNTPKKILGAFYGGIRCPWAERYGMVGEGGRFLSPNAPPQFIIQLGQAHPRQISCSTLIPARSSSFQDATKNTDLKRQSVPHLMMSGRYKNTVLTE